MIIDKNRIVYAGFWSRLCAAIVDLLLVSIIAGTINSWIFPGTESHWNWICNEYGDCHVEFSGSQDTSVLLFLAVLTAFKLSFWNWRSATPGKMMMRLVIVDARTGETPTMRQFVGRFFSYFLSAIPLFLGFFWIGFDQRKRGFHDKLSQTAVVRAKIRLPAEDFI